jgi:hypothetical protein
MTKIRVLSGSFLQLKAQHIYRAYNKEVDQLSKEALFLDEDGIHYAVGTEGHTIFFERLDIS